MGFYERPIKHYSLSLQIKGTLHPPIRLSIAEFTSDFSCYWHTLERMIIGAYLPFGASLFQFVCIFSYIGIVHVHILKTIQYFSVVFLCILLHSSI